MEMAFREHLTMRNMNVNYRCLCLRWVRIWLVILSACSAAVTSAQAPEAPGPSDVRLVIDISGSMKKNDPQNLRQPALDMLVKLLPKDSKAGVWTFGQYVNMLVPHGVIDRKWIAKAESSTPQIRSIAQFTNIGEALEKAAYDHKYTKNNYQKHIILLTDGMVDIDRNSSVNRRERQRILDQVLPMYQKAGFTLHTIALSDNADQQLMNKLALMTDGKAAIANNAEELMGAFLSVFNQAVPAEELPFDGNSFFTDSSIEEFTALIFRKPGSESTKIISPDRQTYTKDTNDSRVSWHHTKQYDLITIRQPLEGEWRVKAEVEPQSQITVVSDLSLVVKSMPNNLQVDEEIKTSLVLQEENKTIKRAEFLDLLNIDVNISQDGKDIWNQRLSDGLVPGNGVYSTVLKQFSKEGQYKIDFIVDGKTFKRQFTHNLTVLDAFAVNVDKTTKNGKVQFLVDVIPQSQSIDNNQTEVVGKLKSPKGSSKILPFTKQSDGNWRLLISPDEEGEYILSIRATATDQQGKSFDYIPDSLRLTNSQDNSVFETIISEPETPVEEPPAVQYEPAPEEVIQEPEEVPEVSENVVEEDGTMQIILYSILGVVNILIILVVYFLYRKFFKSSKKDDDIDDIATPESEAAASAEPEFTEPPMDEMVIEELDEGLGDDIDLSEDVEEAAPEPSPEEEEVDDVLSEMMDEDLDEEEVPEFSLDDFAPDADDDADTDGEDAEKKE